MKLPGDIQSPPHERVPLRAIAEHAGVSRMTVSLALRNDSSLSPATRQRVQSMARQMGYVPDPEIARLMERIRENRRRGTTSTLAFLTAHERRTGWQTEPTDRLYHEGAELRARELGYQLEEFWLGAPGMTDVRLGTIIRNRGIEGVLVAPLPGTTQPFGNFTWGDFSVVGIGYSMREPALCRSSNHEYQSMLLLVRKLSEAGYRRIGLAITAGHDEQVNHAWRGAYSAGQSQWPASGCVPPLVMSDWSRPAFVRWLRRYKPDAIVTIRHAVSDWLRELGLRTPEDIGLANVALTPDMEGTTGIDQNSRIVGAAAVELLVSLLRRNERGIPAAPRLAMVEGRFVQGSTTRRTGA